MHSARNLPLNWFAEPFRGYVIRLGDEARKRPDPYVWAVLISDDGKWLIARDGELLIPLADDGEIGPVSTAKLSISAARTAIKAAESLGKKPFWRHRHTQEKTMAEQIDCKMVFSVTQGGKPFFESAMNWTDTGYNGMHDMQKAICEALLNLGEPHRDPAPVPAQ